MVKYETRRIKENLLKQRQERLFTLLEEHFEDDENLDKERYEDLVTQCGLSTDKNQTRQWH